MILMNLSKVVMINLTSLQVKNLKQTINLTEDELEESENIEAESDNYVEKNETSEQIEGPSNFILWEHPDGNFVPRKQISTRRACTLAIVVKHTMTLYQYFKKLFPFSLLVYLNV